MKRILITLLFALTSAATAVAAECSPEITTVPDLPSTARGQTVTIAGKCLPKAAKVLLRTGKSGDNDVPLNAQVAPDGNSISFQLPKELQPGRYLVYLTADSRELPVPGDLRVLTDEPAKPKIDSISPANIYPSGPNDTYNFEISGQNLGKTPGDNVVEVVGRGPQPKITDAPQACQQKAATKLAKDEPKVMCLSYDPGMDGRKLNVSGFNAGNYEGPVKIQVWVGNNVSDPYTVTFSRLPEGLVRLLAFFASIVFAVIVFWMVSTGIKRSKGDDSGTVLDWFFLDKQTDSYSLSKFQLIAWTAVAIFGYVYVLLCRLLIQWNFEFPPIPNGWPTLLGISAGAAVAAVGVTNTRGSKGAGPLKPSFADFISSGGMVTSDRFQFFVWTLVGFLGFLLLILLADPATLKVLPEVPQGFLYLMGISAAGYLGGKVVRLPGPVINQVLVQSATPAGKDEGKDVPASVKMKLTGENLSTDASIKIDGDDLRKDQQFTIDDGGAKPPDGAPDSSFRTELVVELKKADKYIERQHTLAFTNNKDGQMAVAKFPKDPLTIDPVADQPQGTNSVTFAVKGANFEDNMTAEWIDAAKGAVPVSVQVKKKSDKEAEITLTPGATKGEGKLTLISAIKLRASTPVNVV